MMETPTSVREATRRSAVQAQSSMLLLKAVPMQRGMYNHARRQLKLAVY